MRFRSGAVAVWTLPLQPRLVRRRATVAAFGAQLRDAVDVETVLDELAAAAGRSLEPTHFTVWVRAAS